MPTSQSQLHDTCCWIESSTWYLRSIIECQLDISTSWSFHLEVKPSYPGIRAYLGYPFAAWQGCERIRAIASDDVTIICDTLVTLESCIRHKSERNPMVWVVPVHWCCCFLQRVLFHHVFFAVNRYQQSCWGISICLIFFRICSILIVVFWWCFHRPWMRHVFIIFF